MKTIEALNNALEFVEELGRDPTLSSSLDTKRARLERELMQALMAPDAQPEPLTEHADHVSEIATSMRLVAKLAGCPQAVPENDHTAVGAIFSVLGNMRRAMERQERAGADAAIRLAPHLHIGACITEGRLHATVMHKAGNGPTTVVAMTEMAVDALKEHDCIATMTPAAPH